MSEISVIVPVYNAEKYVSRCIESILAQTYDSFELILIDDGSADSSYKILETYASQDKRVIVKHKPNGGHASARNLGIDVACESTSNWITFIDSDDWVDRHYLEWLFNAVKNSEASISVCGYKRVKDGENVAEEETSESVLYPTEKFWCEKRINATIPCGKLFPKKLFSGGSRFPNKVHDDEHIVYQWLFSCDKIAYIKAELYNYYYNTSSVMVSSWSPKRMDSVYAIKERREYFRENHFNQALELDDKLYLEEVYNTFCNFKPIKKSYKKEYRFLKRELQVELKTNAERLGYGKKDASYMWFDAFPISKIGYICKRAVRKIFK